MKVLNAFFAVMAFILLNTHQAEGHALFIKVAPEATVGQEQPVKVYYSEPDETEVEPADKWYSDVATFTLWLIDPAGNRTQLKTEAKADHVSAAFTPELEGIYRLEIGHTAAQPADGTAYQFNAFAQVHSGVSNQMAKLDAAIPDLVLIRENAPVNSEIYSVYFKGQPAAGIEATVWTPGGKSMKLQSDSSGRLSFSTGAAGEYTIEATTYHQGETGNTSVSDYKNIWRCATQKIQVK